MCTNINCWTTASVFMNTGLNYCLFIKVLKSKTTNFFSPLFSSPLSETKSKQPSGTKHKLAKAASLPGRNGNPTFAAVAAGYDKSPGTVPAWHNKYLCIFPEYSLCLVSWFTSVSHFRFIVAGGSGLPKVPPTKTEVSSNISVSHTVVDSDGSDR